MSKVCLECGLREDQHHDFDPAMPAGCVCHPDEWGDEVPNPCEEFWDDGEGRCVTCGHDPQCHVAQTTAKIPDPRWPATGRERMEQAAGDETVAEIERLRAALHEIAEEWAGAETGLPVTAQEAYAIELAQRMYRLAVDALRGN